MIDTQVIQGKMEELCTLLLEQDAYHQLRQMIDEFADDERAVEQYDHFIEKQQTMQQKEHQGIPFTHAEIDEYEQTELQLYENDLIRKFLYAQREFSHLHQLVSQYFIKTIELSRLPEPGEMKKEGCGCGGNCGCGGAH